MSELKDLSEYFDTSLSNISTIKKYIAKTIVSANQLLNNQQSCPNDTCDSLFLFKRQTSSSAISKALLDKNSIRDDKNLFFSIEFSAFYEDYYQSQGELYQNLYLTNKQADQLYNVDQVNLHPNPVWDSLPHYSNLRDLREGCKAFWGDNLSDEDKKLGYFQQSQKMISIDHGDKKFGSLFNIVARFKFASSEQAEVMCGYIEYIFENMLMISDGGDFELFVLSQLASENLEKRLWKVREVVSQIMWDSFVGITLENHPAIDCETVLAMDQSIPFEKAKDVCIYYIQKDVTEFLKDLYDNCENDSPNHSFGFTDLQLVSFCTLNEGKEVAYSTLFKELSGKLKTVYGFKDSDSFSTTKLALMQLTNSALTNSVNPYLKSSIYPKTMTIADWKPRTFEKPFEFAYFAQKFEFGAELIQALDLATSTAILNKGVLFNVLVLYASVVKAQKGDFKLFESSFKLDKSLYNDFWSMLVLFVRESYLKGFYTNVTSDDIENGFKIDFIDDFRIRPILLGGDPSLPDPVAVRLQKNVFVFEKFTGKDDFRDVDNFISVNNRNTISNSLPIFNGNVTSILYTNPWSAEIPISGCDNFCSEKSHGYNPESKTKDLNETQQFKEKFMNSILSPSSVSLAPEAADDPKNPRTIAVYGSPINRTLEYQYIKTDKTPFMNLKTHHYKLIQSQYDATHPEYNQAQVNGFLNMTNVFNFPILFSQNHHYNVDQRLAGKFKYFDKSGNPIEPNEDRDGGNYTVEDKTHGVTRMILQLHFNAEIRPDLKLFIGKEQEIEHLRADPSLPIIVPLYNLEYFTGLSEEKYKNIFGMVATANSFIDKYFAIFVTLFLVFLVLFLVSGFFWYREYKKMNHKNNFLEESAKEELLNDEAE